MTSSQETDMSYIELRESTPEGQQGMAAARLALSVRAIMQSAVTTSGITQKELAARLLVGESRVSQILSGDGNVRISTLAKVLRACGYKPELSAEPVDESVKPLPVRRRRRPRLEQAVDEAVPVETSATAAKVVHNDKKLRDRITVARGSKKGLRVEAIEFQIEADDAEAFYVITQKDVTTTIQSNGWKMELAAKEIVEKDERVGLNV